MILMNELCHFWLFVIVIIAEGKDIALPGSCHTGQYYEPNKLGCEACSANASLTSSDDGFGCSCTEHSVPVSVGRCKPCNATEVVSSDGRACVPRRCQGSAGKFVCRKCPADYITVTQNLDGSPLKEVQCVKCARGFQAQRNICVRCDSCVCNKNQAVVRGVCVPKSYVNARPKYEDTSLHPLEMLDIVKFEYLCTQNDVRACRTLAHYCVKYYYSTEPAGPCRLWTQSNTATPKGLPQLTVQPTLEDKRPGEINLAKGNDMLFLVGAVHKASGSLEMHKEENEKALSCLLHLTIKLGHDFTHKCSISSSKLNDYLNTTVSPYLYNKGHLVQIPVHPIKPNGYHIQRGTWSSNEFKRYFIVEKFLSISTNTTNIVFLKTMTIRIEIERDKTSQGSLRVSIDIDVMYSQAVGPDFEMTLQVTHGMPEAGVFRGIEIWCGVLGSLLVVYALVQWRGAVRRGGLYVCVVPLVCAAVADTLHFAALFATLHALAAEAGTLGLTLPLSSREEQIIKIFVYVSVSLKAVKIAWVNINQCRNDVFFLDWSQYNTPPPFRDATNVDKPSTWRAAMLAREWGSMQTLRRVSPGYTVTLTLLILHLLAPWQANLPQSQGYSWAIASIAWWGSYMTLLAARWGSLRVSDPTRTLPKTCSMTSLSLLVFEEEYYAHYVHGRSEESKDLRVMAGPLATCRIVCAPQLRIIYKQLSISLPEMGDTETRQVLLSRFLAAFFERALHGLSWVASERTLFERLLDVELTTREAGNTSTLLYDAEDSTPSCFNVTWWGEEWSLATFDAMLFSAILLATQDVLLAALVTVIVWQIMGQARKWFGFHNQIRKTYTKI